MRARIAHLLTPPVFEDRDKTRLAATLYRVLLGALAVVVANAVLTHLLEPYPAGSAPVNTAICLLVALAMWIVRKGHLRLAMATISASLWFIVTFVAVVFVGMNTPILGSYIAVAVLVGFFAGGRAVVGYSIVTSAFILATAWAETQGLMPAPMTAFTLYTTWITVTAGLAMTSILIILALRDTREALDEARRNEGVALEASRAVEAGRALLETRARQQATVAELGQLALADTSPSDLIDVAAKAVAHTLAVDFVSVLERLPDAKAFLLRAGVGWDEQFLGSFAFPVEDAGQAGHTLLANEPVVVEDWGREARFPLPAGLGERGVASGLSVVIHGANEPYGVFGAHSKKPRRYSHDEVHFLQSVANLITLAIRREKTDEALRKSEENLRQAQKGLGLSTVHGIVSQSGGGISVASEPGRWTRFVIHLPRCDEAPASDGATERAGTPLGSETVLLAEDDPRVRRLTRRMLEDLGYEVLEAEDGARALALAEGFAGPFRCWSAT